MYDIDYLRQINLKYHTCFDIRFGDCYSNSPLCAYWIFKDSVPQICNLPMVYTIFDVPKLTENYDQWIIKVQNAFAIGLKEHGWIVYEPSS